jgi:PAS domain S-box-containing protein
MVVDGKERADKLAITLIVALFAAITNLRALIDDPAAAVGALYALPIAMVAVRWGVAWGLVTAAASYVTYLTMSLILGQDVGAAGDVIRAMLYLAAAVLVGGYAERARRTDRRRAERFHEVIETSHEAYVAMDREGRVTAWNREAERIFGLPAAEALGRPVADLIVPEALREAHWEGLRRVQSGGESRVLGKRLELKAMRKGGEEFPIEITIAPMIDDDGETSYHAFMHDISDRIEAAAEADRVKSEFFALVSHELKTPLTAMMGFQELIEQSEGEKLSEQGRRYLELIGSSGEELNTRIGDLLLVAQVEAGTFQVDLSRVDLAEVVHHSVESARAHAERAGVELSLRQDTEREEIDGDRRRLGQVVDNLISNALKFTPAEGTVSVTTASRNGTCSIEVADTGMGIGAEDRERLFDRFYRASEAKEKQISGTGLGLSIVDAIVRAHHGEVRLESEPGQGSKFTVLLPRH